MFCFIEIEISRRPEDMVYKVFQDPTARHAIISLRSCESLYLARNSKKPKPIPKLKVGSQFSVLYTQTASFQGRFGGFSLGLIFCTEDRV